MTDSAVRLVCIDLGGVVMRICCGWEQACQRAGLTPPEGVARDACAMSGFLDICRALEVGAIDEAEFDRRAGEAIGWPSHHAAAVMDAWLLGPYPGALDLIGRLGGSRRVRCACLSNTNSRHWRAMTGPGRCYLGLDRLGSRFASFEIGLMKPDPAIYAHVERAFERDGIALSSILFFDDNSANVDAARARGWRAERIDPLNDPPAQVLAHLARHGVEL